MITCKLGDRRYSVDYVTGRALREMEPAMRMYGKIVKLAAHAQNTEENPPPDSPNIPEAMDEMVRWFCLLFGNQFTPDEVYDQYPVDRLMHDIVLALLAVQAQTTDILSEFPTMAAKATPEPATETTETTEIA